MRASGRSGKSSFVKRRYLLDRPSQISVVVHLVCILAGIGLLFAVAVYVLLGSDVVSEKSPAQTRGILLLVQAAYFVVGGTILAVAALVLTHRYVGPAYVIRRAIQAMREADYAPRLTLRRRDYHKPLARELALLCDELAAGDAARTELLQALEKSLDLGDEQAAREHLERLLDGSRPQRAASA